MRILIFDNLKFCCGDNAKENTNLVADFKESNPNGLWFHLADFPSPHIFYLGDEKLLSNKIYQQIGNYLFERVKHKVILKKNQKLYLTKAYLIDLKLGKTPGEVYVIKSNNIKINLS